MKQETQQMGGRTTSLAYVTPSPPSWNQEFAALFIAAAPGGVDVAEVKRRLKLSESEARGVVDDLQRGYLADVVSSLDGDKVTETLRLTEEGAAILQLELEAICELPELD